MPAYWDVAPPAPKTFTAEADIVANRFVKIGAAANGVTPVTAVTDQAVGVAVETVDTPDVTGVSVWLCNEGGIVPVEAAAAIAAGALVAPSANGRAQTAVVTQFARGVALEAASGAGHIIPILVRNDQTAQ